MQLANMKALVDARHLQSALPLQPNKRVKVPLMLHVAQVAASPTHALPLHVCYVLQTDSFTINELAFRCRWDHTQEWRMLIYVYT